MSNELCWTFVFANEKKIVEFLHSQTYTVCNVILEKTYLFFLCYATGYGNASKAENLQLRKYI
jgi:hypothetical protein